MNSNRIVLAILVLACSTFASLPTECIDAFHSAVLKAHNAYRVQHHVPQLTINTTVVNIAMKYAEKLSSTNTFQHSYTKGLGENLAWMSSSSLPSCETLGSNFVKKWYDEIKDYDFSNPGFSSGTGHFTQVVWKGSKSFGCGLAIANNQAYGVCNYYPPGNYLRQFDSNVLRI
ncbi:cysteine-rich secretory -2 [Brachionus plicatilis]|uniref:Cysteine-rich secretory-2 n=1 Tax=Brachionus plicatilis TaxID=10195 RepID=A0A3M7R2E8_BRAPC|nr:cysteine-rich secretory -2 [Brachionus plicatilis]